MAKPFLKWAGGKRQLIADIESRLPDNISEIETYCEPFIGGGALLFHMLSKYKFENVHISDINPELILCYQQIQSSVEDVINFLEGLTNDYPLDVVKRDEFYYDIRSKWNSNLDLNRLNDKEKSLRVAQMIFLNKTCFNGLFRLNRKGEFNVPTGRYAKPSFPSAKDLRLVNKALELVTIKLQSYQECVGILDENSFVYFDPPYRPISKTSSPTIYTKDSFNDDNQAELALFVRRLDDDGVKFLLSNSDPKNTVSSDNFFDELYRQFKIKRVSANRSINSNPSKRGAITELLISNY